MTALLSLQSPPVDLPDGSASVLVLDADAVSRIGLGVLLQRERWVSRCLCASNRDEAVMLAERHKPDVAIVDVSRAGPFIASHVAPLRGAHPAMPILLSSRCRSTPSPSPSSVGAYGVLPPGSTPEEVIATVRAALVGDNVPAVPHHNQIDTLSEREREVLALISTGATNREIAAVMHVGAETVKKHAAALYRKLDVRNRTEAAQLAAELLAA